MNPAPRMLTPADFLGPWAVERRIEDRLGPPGRFDGLATFAPEGEALRCREQGTLTLGDRSFPASRETLWLWDDAGVEVRFSDGRPFHRFDGAGRGTDHPCGRDLYRVRYDFSAWPLWRAEWAVTGPAKDYVLRSLYRRA